MKCVDLGALNDFCGGIYWPLLFLWGQKFAHFFSVGAEIFSQNMNKLFLWGQKFGQICGFLPTFEKPDLAIFLPPQKRIPKNEKWLIYAVFWTSWS